MNICNIRMEQALPRFPVEVLNYAAKHGYPNLVEAAVPCLLDMPMEIVVQKLSDSLVVPWVCMTFPFLYPFLLTRHDCLHRSFSGNAGVMLS
ncbi:hypothetical protein J132_10369 [Termitomyces sp. J132]|nr:hypothetical protein J132_10369 [Termitomyces sp. J132]